MKKIIISALLCSLSFSLTNAQKVNINCPEGANWQVQKRASVKLGWGSASLINNGDGKIYLLTARHCMYNEPMLENSTWQLTFGEEYTTCSGSTAGTSVTADVVIKPVARSYTHDYALAEIITDLSTIPGLDLSQIYINGYDRTETAPTSGTYIGFPGLEKKRIGTYNTTVNPNVQYYSDGGLGVNLIATTSGYQGASGGASGSPVFDQNKRTKSVLFAVGGGNSNADGSSQMWTYSLAGAWIHGENESGGPQLGRTMQAALDPKNTSLPYTNGIELTEMRRLVNGAKYIVSKKTGYVLGITGTSLVTDTKNTTTPSLPNKFILKAEVNGYYSIGVSGTTTTLTCLGSHAGDPVRTSDYVVLTEGVQRFRILPTGKGDNTYYIQDIIGGLNLALQSSSNSSGVPITMGTQSGNDLEEWYLTDVAPLSTARTSGVPSREMKDSSSSISVYPVPAVDYLNVKVSSDKKVKAVSVVNTMGREVFRTEQISLEGQSVKIDVQKLITGNYMVNGVFTDGSQSSAKFLKK